MLESVRKFQQTNHEDGIDFRRSMIAPLKRWATATSSQKRFEPQQMSPRGWPDVLASVLLTVAVAILFHTAPRAGDFWWSDAPRHAMDGAFYKDFFHDLPLSHAKQYAINYYVQYPA